MLDVHVSNDFEFVARPSHDEVARAIERAVARFPVVRFLVGGASDRGLYEQIAAASEDLRRMEDEARRLARGYTFVGDVAVVDARTRTGPYDKALLLLLGQERAPISVVHDETAVTAAARFDSGIDLLAILGLSGGMPTRVSVTPNELDVTLEKLRTR